MLFVFRDRWAQSYNPFRFVIVIAENAEKALDALAAEKKEDRKTAENRFEQKIPRVMTPSQPTT